MTESAEPEAAGRRSLAPRMLLHLLVGYGVLPTVLVFMYVGFGLVEPRFHTAENAVNILRQASYITILATAQMFVLLTRGFDLSIGTVISMVSVATALVMMGMVGDGQSSATLAIAVAILFALGLGAVIGAANGVCVSFFGINPFVVTLGMEGIALGFATTLSGGFPVSGLPRALNMAFDRSNWLGVPAPLAVCLIVLAVTYFVLNHTVFGRTLYLIGGNPRAAFVAGRASRLHNALAYVVCSVIVAIVTVLLLARTGSGEPNLGGGLMLESIAAAVIGGVSLRGGEGRVIHCVFGGLFVTILSIGMNLVRVDSYVQQIILGVVIVAAVYLDQFRNRRFRQ